MHALFELVEVQGVRLFEQIENVPLLLFPNSQNLMYTVLPGVSPVNDNDGINPLALPSSLHPTNDKLLQGPE